MKTTLLDAPFYREGIFTEGGQSDLMTIVYLGLMLLAVLTATTLANWMVLK